MTPGFVPLPASGTPDSAHSFRLRVIPGAAAAGEFTPWAPVSTAPPAMPDHNVMVELQSEGDRVSGARIRCACGRAIDLVFTF